MINLTREESILLLACKGKNLKELPKDQYDTTEMYVQRVSGYIAGGSTDTKTFLFDLFWKLYPEDWHRRKFCMQVIDADFFTKGFTPTQKLISWIRNRSVTDLTYYNIEEADK